MTKLHPALVLRTIFTAVSIIILPFLWLLFWRYREHFLLKYRYPTATILASCAMLIVTATLVAIGYFEHYLSCNVNTKICIAGDYDFIYNFVGAFGQASAFVWCSLILLRTYWVYDKWIITKYRLNHMHNIIKAPKLVNTVPKAQRELELTFNLCGQHIPKKWVYYIFYACIIMVFSLQTAFFHIRNKGMMAIVVLIFLFIGIVGIWLIYKVRTVEEALNCVNETYATVFILFFQLFNANILVYAIDRHWRYAIATILSLFGSYSIIVTGLYLVNKNRIWIQQEPSVSTDNSIMGNMVHSIQNSTSNDAPDVTGNNTTKAKELETYGNRLYVSTNHDKKIDVSKIALNSIGQLKLHQLLSANYDYYALFANYLSSCFCIENLLFLVNSITFRQTLLRLHDKISGQRKREDPYMIGDYKTQKEAVVFKIKFDYLPDVYIKYMELTDLFTGHQNRKLDAKKIKELINNFTTDIYNAFVKLYSIHEINISHQLRIQYDTLIETKNSELNEADTNVSNIIENYIGIYDHAIMEIWYLLRSVYSSFKVEQKVKNDAKNKISK